MAHRSTVPRRRRHHPDRLSNPRQYEQDTPMPITLASVIIDAADIEKESSFWHRLLGGSVTPTPTHHFVQAPGLPVIVVQSAPGHTAPNWPHGTSQQMHLDFGVEDLATADRTATDAGCHPTAPHRRDHPGNPHRQPHLRQPGRTPVLPTPGLSQAAEHRAAPVVNRRPARRRAAHQRRTPSRRRVIRSAGLGLRRRRPVPAQVASWLAPAPTVRDASASRTRSSS